MLSSLEVYSRKDSVSLFLGNSTVFIQKHTAPWTISLGKNCNHFHIYNKKPFSFKIQLLFYSYHIKT